MRSLQALFFRRHFVAQAIVDQALAPGVIRTHNLLIRSQMLYPVELRVRNRMGRVPRTGVMSSDGQGGRAHDKLQMTDDKWFSLNRLKLSLIPGGILENDPVAIRVFEGYTVAIPVRIERGYGLEAGILH